MTTYQPGTNKEGMLILTPPLEMLAKLTLFLLRSKVKLVAVLGGDMTCAACMQSLLMHPLASKGCTPRVGQAAFSTLPTQASGRLSGLNRYAVLFSKMCYALVLVTAGIDHCSSLRHAPFECHAVLCFWSQLRLMTPQDCIMHI